jgi:light-regulated signal transduction histidine kinase (bacteriophytochrome)
MGAEGVIVLWNGRCRSHELRIPPNAIGLYICQTLATRIGAEITFESELGWGSTSALEVRE